MDIRTFDFWPWKASHRKRTGYVRPSPARLSRPELGRELALNATALLRALVEKRISAVELVDFAISRINALDQKINAVVVTDFERARTAAFAADAALARGERRPLLGLPMTVKESFDVAELPTTRGNIKFKDWRPSSDSLAVARLKRAGAIILGKTNVPFMLRDWQTYNEIYGITNNPWDLARTPGGSSGGSAAALAAGFVPLELGSDIGGSLRAPAHYCGVFAHKPSLGLVPLRISGPQEIAARPIRGFFTVAGPMARSAADLALALKILAGPDPMSEGKAYELVLPPPRHQSIKNFRVLVIDSHPLYPTAMTVRAALNRLSERLERSGACVLRASPMLPDLANTARIYVELLSAFFGTTLPFENYQRSKEAAKSVAPDDLSLSGFRLRGSVCSYRDWTLAHRMCGQLRLQWWNLFKEFDVVLCPPMPTLAFPHNHTEHHRMRWLEIDGNQFPYSDQIVWASIATLSDLPATVAPIELAESGLPTGVQIIGPHLEDNTAIAFAGMIEREFGGFIQPPTKHH